MVRVSISYSYVYRKKKIILRSKNLSCVPHILRRRLITNKWRWKFHTSKVVKNIYKVVKNIYKRAAHVLFWNENIFKCFHYNQTIKVKHSNTLFFFLCIYIYINIIHMKSIFIYIMSKLFKCQAISSNYLSFYNKSNIYISSKIVN